MNTIMLGELTRQRINVPPASENRQRIEALLQSPEWTLVALGIARQRRATKERLAAGVDLSEREMRELQGRCAVMADILTRPLEFLVQFSDDEGDELPRKGS